MGKLNHAKIAVKIDVLDIRQAHNVVFGIASGLLTGALRFALSARCLPARLLIRAGDRLLAPLDTRLHWSDALGTRRMLEPAGSSMSLMSSYPCLGKPRAGSLHDGF